MLDPWLPTSNFTDYLVDQFANLQSDCSTTLPYSTSSATLFIPPTSTASTASTTSTTSGAATAAPTCLGQIVAPQADFLTCNDLSDLYGISTGDARVATGDCSCEFTTTICLPLPCELDTVWDSPSCPQLAERYSNSTYTVSQSQFLAWNGNIQGSCDGVSIGQRLLGAAPQHRMAPAVQTTAERHAPTPHSAIVAASMDPAAPAQTFAVRVTAIQGIARQTMEARPLMGSAVLTLRATRRALAPSLAPAAPPRAIPFSPFHASMDLSQLPDISTVLVSLSNPVRTANPPALDHARCAQLHNYLVKAGWLAPGRSLSDLPQDSFFDRHGDTAEQLRDQLDPSVVAFLESIIIHDDYEVPVFFWVENIAGPSRMFASANETLFPDEDEKNDVLSLYLTNPSLGEHSLGLLYDQRHHRAVMALGIEDTGFFWPVEEHENLWHPLETVLSNWIALFHLGKVKAIPPPNEEDDDSNADDNDDAAQNVENESEAYGPWSWQPYSPAQVDGAVAAFDRLAAAIEERMPAPPQLSSSSSPQPPHQELLLSPSDLDAASVPCSCFIRSFLTRIRAPRFRTIAPGLLVPHDPSAFAASQLFTPMPADSEYGTVIPPVLIFPAVGSSDGNQPVTVSFDPANRYQPINPFCRAFQDGLPRGAAVPAGLYSESVERFQADVAEEGFRLVLPFCLAKEARKSDGRLLVEDGDVRSADVSVDLFQHGFKPFGGEWWRAQPLERLLIRWRELVQDGVWTVGAEGVEGGWRSLGRRMRGGGGGITGLSLIGDMV
ncbi:hypothetical protein B0T17DRAFT_598686 [Bombardia bombarda]|uniref:Uncharacterized protein n=1 Tax=Bombardia bombarda TaxID=252184 RepID=A0AA40CAQ9_9PEZI|nr:hypothetical protein B0T17DRAFT_598686 [Bombardia bombarda]